ncbi:MAG TPA: hypothetical protein EYG75_07135 [Campylobacterales bacterium]|nr:hypothetical protein [Campylobacterales bacterium]
MHKMIIYGYSKLAEQIAGLLLQKGCHFSILENDKESIERALNDGYKAYESNLNEDENLISAGITKGVQALFCVSEDANSNLFVTLSARALDKNLRIIALASSKESEKKMLLAGADSVINPYEIGAQRLFRLMRKPTLFSVLDRILFSTTEIKIGEVKIEKESKFIGTELAKIAAKSSLNILVVGIQSGDEFIFDTNRVRYHVCENDVIVVMGKEAEIKKFTINLKEKL